MKWINKNKAKQKKKTKAKTKQEGEGWETWFEIKSTKNELGLFIIFLFIYASVGIHIKILDDL